MNWIKRNLLFALALAAAVLLLAGAVVYDLQSLNHNSAAKDKLNEIYGTLTQIGGGKYSWGNDQIDNIKTARSQVTEIQNWMKKAAAFFAPIAPIPNTPNVTSEAFANALRVTIDQLQREATGAGVEVPPKYAFSFEQQRSSVKYAPGSLPLVAEQLGEVKTISEILFAARVNALDSVQRVRVSEDDVTGPQADYISDVPTTNNLAILTPYVITFRSFSGELAAALAGFAASPKGVIVTGINVAPAGQAAQAVVGMNGYEQARAGYNMPPATAPGAVTMPARGGLPTVLNEQKLRVTIEVKIVKMSLKK